jgi:hypothetical protein
MQRTRRSGRIAKEVPILLMGTDTAGKVFAEQTTTVVLSRHGAGIVSKYRFAPDEVLTLRLLGTSKEAEVRLVGQIGGEPGRYVYGLAFVDPELKFWPMEFPPPETFQQSYRLALACSLCDARREVEQGEIEEDVYSVNGNVLRFCERCGTTTPWEKISREAAPVSEATPAESVTTPSAENPASPEVSRLGETSSLAPAFFAASSSYATPPTSAGRERTTAAALPPSIPSSAIAPNSPNQADTAASDAGASGTLKSSSAPSSTVLVASSSSEAIVSLAEMAQDVAAPTPAPEPPSQAVPAAPGRRVNRRRHVRIRVNFSACVRDPVQGDEIVECENMSKGGICFHSRKRYPVDSEIEIAAPYSPGGPALFVPAKIVRMDPIPGSPIIRHAIAFLRQPSKAPVF